MPATTTLSLEQEYRRRLEARMRGLQLPVSESQHAIRAIDGLHFSFTGALGFMPRHEAVRLIQDSGGFYDRVPDRRTNFLVCGTIPLSAMQPGVCSRKLQRAHNLGTNILSADSFKQLLIDSGVYSEE